MDNYFSTLFLQVDHGFSTLTHIVLNLLQHLMLMGNLIHPPELLRTSFGHFWTAFSTLYAYFCTKFSTLTAHFEEEFSTPYPSFQTILGPWVCHN